ncbi:MAG: P-loop NTPase [Acidobacteria bacterium]|nr:P-loop NTPase [Acidobacteriota bacterium]
MGTEFERARRVAIISGKGGVGKTFITANLAATLSLNGSRVLVVDADLGLANLDILLGVTPDLSILDVIRGDQPLDKVLLQTQKGFDFLPAASGLPEGTALTQILAEGMESILGSIEDRYDFILFDAGAGVGDVVLFFAGLSDEILLVATPEPTSLMDTYAAIKILNQLHGRSGFLLVVNQTNPDHSGQIGTAVVGHLQSVISKFIDSDKKNPVRIELIGSIPMDPAIPHAIRQRQLLAEVSPDAPAASYIDHLADCLHARTAC